MIVSVTTSAYFCSVSELSRHARSGIQSLVAKRFALAPASQQPKLTSIGKGGSGPPPPPTHPPTHPTPPRPFEEKRVLPLGYRRGAGTT